MSETATGSTTGSSPNDSPSASQPTPDNQNSPSPSGTAATNGPAPVEPEVRTTFADSQNPSSSQTQSQNSPEEEQPQPIPPPPPPPQPQYKGYNGNMTDYCKEHESWLQRAHLQRECAVSAYFTALSMMFGGPGVPGGVGDRGSSLGNGHVPNNHNHNQPLNNNFGNWMNMNNMNFPRQPGGINVNPVIRRILVRGVRTNNNVIAIDFNMAPIWKRILAECIDFVLLLVVKLFVTVTIIDSFELIDLDNIDLDALHENGGLLEVAVSLTWELLILELTHRIVVCFFEAWCLYKSGATPGKNLLNLRVLHCDQVIQLAPDQPIDNNGLVIPAGTGRILVSPGSFLTFPRALLRSAIKNFSLAFFFPFAFVFFHLEQSRTIYDLATRSIVVEFRQ